MSGTVADFRDKPLSAAELEMLDQARAGELVAKRPRGAKRVLPAALEIIDVAVPRPEQVRVARFCARFIGRPIGIAAVYVIAAVILGAMWAGRGVARSAAWAARRARR